MFIDVLIIFFDLSSLFIDVLIIDVLIKTATEKKNGDQRKLHLQPKR